MTYFEFGSSKDELANISFNELKYYKTQIGLVIYFTLFFPIFTFYYKLLRKAKQYITSKALFFLYFITPFSGFLMILVGVITEDCLVW